MRNVLLVSPSAKPGGAERTFAALARRLPAHGWHPTVVLLEDGPLAEWIRSSGTEPVILRAARTRQLHRAAATVRSLARLARRSGADAVISSMTKGHIYGGSAARLARLPAVWWQHDIPKGTRMERIAMRVPAAAIVCVGEAAARSQRQLTPRRRVEKIFPGTAVAELAARRGSGAALRHSIAPDGGPIVGIVGRLQPWKGQEVFLRAAARVGAARQDVRFAVVGGAILGWEGSYPNELELLTDGLGIRERVFFAGHQADPVPWQDALDVVVHASEREPFGLVIVEAMALGKAVVATAGGGPEEIIEDGRSGLIVPPGNPAALAAAIERVLADPELRDRLERGAAERAPLFGEERAAARVAALLDDLIGPAQARDGGTP